MVPEALADFERHNGGHPGVNYRVRMVIHAPAFQVRIDAHAISAEAKRRDPFFQEHYRAWEAEHCCIARLPDVGEAQVALAVLRTERQGVARDAERARLQNLLPAVHRLLLLQHALERRGGELAAGVLDSVASAAFLLAANGRIMSATQPAAALVRAGEWLGVRAGRLEAVDGDANRILQAALSRAELRPASEAVRSSRVALRSPTGERRWAEVSPFPEAARTLGLGPVMTVVIGQEASVASGARALADAFALTPAEAGVARAIAAGRRLADVAAEGASRS